MREIEMESPICKRSVVINGHKTSVSLEEPFWHEMKLLAGKENKPISEMIASIDQTREGNLSSAIRLFVLDRCRQPRNTAQMA